MVRTWTEEQPDHALVQVDLRNAYGRALRSGMLGSTTCTHQLSRTSWRQHRLGAHRRHLSVHTHCPWGWQGSAAMPITFAVALEHNLRRLTGQLGAQGRSDCP